LWDVIVGAGLLCYMGRTSRGWGSSPGGDHVYVCVFIFILHFEVYSQNVVLVFKLVAKLCILPYTK
jgi:hypothetical protein